MLCQCHVRATREAPSSVGSCPPSAFQPDVGNYVEASLVGRAYYTRPWDWTTKLVMLYADAISHLIIFHDVQWRPTVTVAANAYRVNWAVLPHSRLEDS